MSSLIQICRVFPETASRLERMFLPDLPFSTPAFGHSRVLRKGYFPPSFLFYDEKTSRAVSKKVFVKSGVVQILYQATHPRPPLSSHKIRNPTEREKDESHVFLFQALIYVSTAYSNCDLPTTEEQFYPLTGVKDVRKLVEAIDNLDTRPIQAMTAA